ncbi:MAG: tRNA pseudouridine(13) synthase TruD [Candidatus Woesearchaeota archaeon]
MDFILKENPEDFIVDEVFKRKLEENGKYSICRLKKINYNTEDAIKTICNSLNIKRNRAGYAGLKDRRAITYQTISLLQVPKNKIENLDLKDIELEFLGYSNGPVSLGDLEGNKFEIRVKNVDTSKIKRKEKILNLFDSQRFSSQNHLVGRHIIKGEFEEAARKLENIKSVKEHLVSHPNDYVNAIRTIPKKILLIYVHAYQSFIWNKIAHLAKTKTLQIPGFGLEIDENSLIKKALDEEGLTQRDFIVRQIPGLSCEGANRDVFVEIKDLEISVFPEKKEALFKFYLPKGSYATLVVKNLIED